MPRYTANPSEDRFADQLSGFEQLRLSWRLFRDERVPTWMKSVVPIVAAVYVILPIDLIPDFVLGLGQVDDVGIIGIALFAMSRVLPRLAPRAVVGEHLDEMRHGRRGRRKRENVIDTSFEVVEKPAAHRRERGFDGIQETRA